MSQTYPRLLIISDVAVELTVAGSTLLYRLFENYPHEKLVICQSADKHPERALQNVQYLHLDRFSSKFRNTRLNQLVSFFDFFTSLFLNRKVRKVVQEFDPEHIISVTFRFFWLTAFRLSKQQGVPLHLILHDDLILGEKHGKVLNRFIEYKFRQAYLFATSRLCISEAMEKHYYQKYCVEGTVVYPMGGLNDRKYSIDVVTFAKKSSLHFCYAGSVYTSDFLHMLDVIAAFLIAAGHRLTIFCEADSTATNKYNFLSSRQVIVHPLVHPDDLKRFMIENIDVNILLNSFENEQAFQYNFSSKIVEYSAVPLPILMWGPASSATICWAKEQKYACISNASAGQKICPT